MSDSYFCFAGTYWMRWKAFQCRLVNSHGQRSKIQSNSSTDVCAAPIESVYPTWDQRGKKKKPAWGQNRKRVWGTAFLQMHYYQVFTVSAGTSQLGQAVTNCSLSNPSSPPSAGPNEGAIRGKVKCLTSRKTHKQIQAWTQLMVECKSGRSYKKHCCFDSSCTVVLQHYKLKRQLKTKLQLVFFSISWCSAQ